jgi:hypothetical protein
MMSRITSAILLFFSSHCAFGQGGVDVVHVAIDSVNSSFVGREVKLDFKCASCGKGAGSAWRRDKVMLEIDTVLVEFMEVKGRGVDHYYFKDEYLQSLAFKPEHVLRVDQCVVRRIDQDRILFEITFVLYRKTDKNQADDFIDKEQVMQLYGRGGKVQNYSFLNSWRRDVWIERDKLDYLLIRNW